MGEKSRFVEFNLLDAKHIFDKLEGMYGKNEVQSWRKTAKKNIDEMFEKYKVTSYALNKQSYMGIVLDCSSANGDLYIKLVPPMLNRFFFEVETLSRLPKELTCRRYAII